MTEPAAALTSDPSGGGSGDPPAEVAAEIPFQVLNGANYQLIMCRKCSISC